MARAHEHLDALRALARRLGQEYAGVATPGRVLALVFRTDRAHRGPGPGRLGVVEQEVRRLLDAAVTAQRTPVGRRRG